MRGYVVALALALAIPCAFGTAPAAAQSDDGSEQAAAEPLTAEKIIEVARERLRRRLLAAIVRLSGRGCRAEGTGYGQCQRHQVPAHAVPLPVEGRVTSRAALNRR